MPPRHGPDWADRSDHDPGITIVGLFAFLGERLGAYADKVAAEARLPGRRTAVALGAVAAAGLLWWRRSGRDDD